jgi:hypothetical protein
MDTIFPRHQSGKWIFQLQHEGALQFHITSEGESTGRFLIEGHEISALLDYLYEHREHIYEATHDQELRRLEALEAQPVADPGESPERHFRAVLYFDDGVQRVRADEQE